MQIGSLAIGGLTLRDILAAQSASENAHRDSSVILLYLHGGPSHLETYDLKPSAPSDYRSIFRSTPTVVPGMDICELFPNQARVADKFSLVRSLNHDIGIHSDGGIIVLTGKRPSRLDPTSQSKSEHPDFGMIASKVVGMRSNSIPPYVTLPQRPYMTLPSYLGVQHGSLELGDPSLEQFEVPHLKLVAGMDSERLGDRRRLLAQLDQMKVRFEGQLGLNSIDPFHEAAYRMLINPEVAKAFDLDQEKTVLRDRYGRHRWGQSCLLARRLAEAGAAVTTLFIDTPKTGHEFTNWDDHILNAGRPGHFGDYMRVRLPYLDQALATLIEDIFDRGLDRKILVVVVGEFGRTPRLSVNASGTGRDHWPQAYTALFSGGGLKMGQVVGATNARGEYPTERPYSPFDMLATIYRHLGIDTSQSLTDLSGRPIPILSEGSPIKELI